MTMPGPADADPGIVMVRQIPTVAETARRHDR